MKITIVIADDHDLIRRSIASFLRSESDLDVVGECANGQELLQLVAHLRPAVVIIDLAIAGLNGVEATKRIKELSKSTRVIALSDHIEGAYVRAMLDAGAVGYIVKSGAAQDLMQAVRKATHGKIHLSAEVSAVVKRSQRSGSRKLHAEAHLPPQLSPRERQVLQLIAESRSSKEIAVKLGISEATVKSHRKHIMEKLDIHDAPGLTRHAIRIGLIRVS